MTDESKPGGASPATEPGTAAQMGDTGSMSDPVGQRARTAGGQFVGDPVPADPEVMALIDAIEQDRPGSQRAALIRLLRDAEAVRARIAKTVIRQGAITRRGRQHHHLEALEAWTTRVERIMLALAELPAPPSPGGMSPVEAALARIRREREAGQQS